MVKLRSFAEDIPLSLTPSIAVVRQHPNGGLDLNMNRKWETTLNHQPTNPNHQLVSSCINMVCSSLFFGIPQKRISVFLLASPNQTGNPPRTKKTSPGFALLDRSIARALSNGPEGISEFASQLWVRPSSAFFSPFFSRLLFFWMFSEDHPVPQLSNC